MINSRILDANGKPFRLPTGTTQTAEHGSLKSLFSEHPGSGLTPDRLNRILKDAERGNLRAMAELGRDIQERNGHVASEMAKRINVMVRIPWQIVPPDNPSAAEKKQAKQMADWIKSIPDFEDVIKDCMDGVGHGFAPLEMQWHNNQRITLPGKIEHRSQGWFLTPPDDGNDLRLNNGTPQGEKLWPYGWIIHKHKARSGALNASGLFRTLAWTHMLRNFGLGDWADFLKNYGQPIRIGTYHPGATEEEKDSLLEAVIAMGQSAAGIISSDMKVAFEKTIAGAHGGYQDLVTHSELTDSKVILGGTLTSQADGKTSTNALGNIHELVRQDLIESDARQVESSLTRQLLLPIFLFNVPGADPARCPQFRLITKRAENIERYGQALPSLVDLGMRISLAWVHDTLGIPEAADDDAVLIPSSPAAPDDGQTMRYRALLASQGSVTSLPPGPAAVQALIDATDRPESDAAMAAMLAPLLAAIDQAATPDDLADLLLASHPHLDAGAIEHYLTQAFFLADVIGRIHG